MIKKNILYLVGLTLSAFAIPYTNAYISDNDENDAVVISAPSHLILSLDDLINSVGPRIKNYVDNKETEETPFFTQELLHALLPSNWQSETETYIPFKSFNEILDRIKHMRNTTKPTEDDINIFYSYGRSMISSTEQQYLVLKSACANSPDTPELIQACQLTMTIIQEVDFYHRQTMLIITGDPCFI